MIPVRIHRLYDFELSELPHEHPRGDGVDSYRFPSGGNLYGVSWQSIVRTKAHEVLFALIVRSNGVDRVLLPTHHVSRDGPTVQTRDFFLSGLLPLSAGDELWVSIRGFNLEQRGALQQGVVELQIVLWVDGDAQPVTNSP